MPTRGRPGMAARAVRCFQAQTYIEKELIILDDSNEPSFTVAPDYPGIVYSRDSSRIIPDKRNLCCQIASGDVIAHWDSDDWSASVRLTIQAQMMEQSGKAVIGFSKMLFVDQDRELFLKYMAGVDDFYCLGTSLFFRRNWWMKNPFEHLKQQLEDNRFTDCARVAGQLHSRDGGRLMVASVHPDNTARKRVEHFPRVSKSEIPPEYFL